jgi:hypothetical protein
MKWAPGQHVFVRVLGLGVHALTSHPFTISSLHTSSGGEGKEEAELELVMRVHGGLTRALARRVAGKAAWATRVVVDGPYGGLHVPLQAYERVYLLAGGSGGFVCFFPFIHSFFRIVLIIIIPGATFTLPIFANLAATLKAGGVSCQRIEFVVAVPDSGSSPFSLESSY